MVKGKRHDVEGDVMCCDVSINVAPMPAPVFMIIASTLALPVYCERIQDLLYPKAQSAVKAYRGYQWVYLHEQSYRNPRLSDPLGLPLNIQLSLIMVAERIHG